MRLAIMACLMGACISGTAVAAEFFQLNSATNLPGSSEGWDYVTLDAPHNRLYIGRRDDGLVVFDLMTRKKIAVIAKSESANAAVLVPSLDRGFTANEDGTSTIFQLSSLKTLTRLKFGADADAVFYEPATAQVLVTMGDSKAVVFLDAKSSTISGKVDLESSKPDGTVADGTGQVFVAERDRNMVARIDAKAHTLVGEWPVLPCEQPTGLAIDIVNKRLFVGCRGAKPVLAILSSEDGHVIASHAIGRGNDGVTYDAIHKRIITSNGIDANLVIFDQIDADQYQLNQAVTTRPNARTMAYDAQRQEIHLVTAEGFVDPSKKINVAVAPFYPNRYDPKTFVVLTYGLGKAAAITGAGK
jgi:hypothetical protein